MELEAITPEARRYAQNLVLSRESFINFLDDQISMEQEYERLNNPSGWAVLPQQLLAHTGSFLNPQEHTTVVPVCQEWNRSTPPWKTIDLEFMRDTLTNEILTKIINRVNQSTVKGLFLGGCENITNLESVGCLRNLEHLNLSQTGSPPEQVGSFDYVPIDIPSAVEALRELTVHSLRLEFTQFSDIIFTDVVLFPHLNYLYIDMQEIPSNGFVQIIERYPLLVELKIGGLYPENFEEFKEDIPILPMLEKINITWADFGQNEDLFTRWMGSLPKLQSIVIQSGSFGFDRMEPGSFPNLLSFVNHYAQYTPDFVESILKVPKLKRLITHQADIQNPRTFKDFQYAFNLQFLSLRGSVIDDMMLRDIGEIPNLQVLELGASIGYTIDGILELVKSNSLKVLDLRLPLNDDEALLPELSEEDIERVKIANPELKILTGFR